MNEWTFQEARKAGQWWLSRDGRAFYPAAPLDTHCSWCGEPLTHSAIAADNRAAIIAACPHCDTYRASDDD